MTWGKYRGIVHMCRDEIKKVKALMEQDLVKDVKNNTKLFFKYPMPEKKRPRRMYSLVNDKREPVTTDIEKTEVLNEFFASVFYDSQVSYISQVPEHRVGVERAKSLLL